MVGTWVLIGMVATCAALFIVTMRVDRLRRLAAQRLDENIPEASGRQYEDTLTIDQLRREVRRCWDRELALIQALRDLPEQAPPDALSFLGEAAKWPEDYYVGKQEQGRLGLDMIAPTTEMECGAGLWVRIRDGLRG